ncbi:cupin domain-containing protein [Leptospira borgpetersenii]|uniref:cupin domain-containing protein n=1 Tax=Leptospira borgpetersenii TaxID=174 RepID=UPI000773ECFD|nr:cupin domain-containing protein [Leptospira borgpetersenii]
MRFAKIKLEYEPDYNVKASRFDQILNLPQGTPFGSAIANLNKGETIKMHNHDEFEIFVILHGEALFSDGKIEKNVFKDDVIFLNPEHMHSFTNLKEDELSILSICWHCKQ